MPISVFIKSLNFNGYDELFKDCVTLDSTHIKNNSEHVRAGTDNVKPFEGSSALAPQYYPLIDGLRVTQNSLQYVNEEELVPQLSTLSAIRAKVCSQYTAAFSTHPGFVPMPENPDLLKELRYQKRMRRCLQGNKSLAAPRVQNRSPKYLHASVVERDGYSFAPALRQ